MLSHIVSFAHLKPIRVIVFTSLLHLSACGGGGGGGASTPDTSSPPAIPATPDVPAWNPNIAVSFPPLEGLFLEKIIPVRGTYALNDIPRKITVDAGAGEVEATLDSLGNWVAEAVPLPSSNTATVVVAAQNHEDAKWQDSVSTLLLERPEFAPRTLMADPINRRIIIEGEEGDLWSYVPDSDELQSLTPVNVEFKGTVKSTYFPGSGEIIRVLRGGPNGCRIRATDLLSGVTRDLLPPQANQCSADLIGLSLSLDGETLYIVDTSNTEIIELNSEGDIIQSTSFTLADSELEQSSSTWLVPPQLLFDSSTGGPYIFGIRWVPVSLSGTMYARLYRLDSLEGHANGTLVIAGQPETYAGGRIAGPAWVGEEVYYSHDGEFRSMSIELLSNNSEQPSGFVALNIASLTSSPSQTDALLILDTVGNVANFHTRTQRMSVVRTLTPYRANTVRLSRLPSVDGGAFAYRRGSRADNGFDISYIDWENLYYLNIEGLALTPSYVTSSEVDGLRGTDQLLEANISIARNSEGLAFLAHETFELSTIPLDYDAIGLIRQYSIGPDGKYLLISASNGLFEIELESLTTSRYFDFSGQQKQSNTLWSPVRGRGEDADIYFSDRNDVAIYRVDFENDTLELVSLPLDEQEEAPLRRFRFMTLVEDSHEILLTEPGTSQLWRMNLNNGLWARIGEANLAQSASYSQGNAPVIVPALKKYYSGVSYTPLSQLDSETGAKVELPLRHR